MKINVAIVDVLSKFAFVDEAKENLKDTNYDRLFRYIY